MLYLLGEVRTNNFNDDRFMEKISTLYEMAYKKIHKQDTNVYVIYHKYNGNYKDDYTLAMASEVKIENKKLILPEDKFEVFNVDTSEENAVLSTWQYIWQLEDEGKIDRLYNIDYEKYNTNGSINIYI